MKVILNPIQRHTSAAASHYDQEANNYDAFDWLQRSGAITARKLQYSTISPSGVLASYDIYHEQIGDAEPHMTTASQTLQVYSATQLEAVLQRNAFKIVQQTAVDETPFVLDKTERILTVARKC